jgi:D-hydroxyproline dehydrogenase
MPMEEQQITVIGAGIVGVCAALALLMRGRRVTLVDRETPGRGCSFGNAGVITPSAFPLAAIAPLSSLPSLLLGRASPLSWHWPSVPALLPWLWCYGQASVAAHVTENTESLHRLAGNALPAYERLLGNGLPGVDRRGYLAVHFTPSEREATMRLNAQRRRFGVATIDLSANQLADLEPSLGALGVGATCVETAAHVRNPARFVDAVFDRFVAGGGVFRRDDVVRLEQRSDGQVGVVGRQASTVARHAVVATGAHANDLLRPLGHAVPLIAERGYHLDLAASAPALTRPVALPAFGVVLSPTDQGTRLVGLSHLGLPGFAPNGSRLHKALAIAQARVPSLRARAGAQVWSGERPATPDSLPVIDRVSGFESVVVCAGHGHLGLTLAAASAHCVVELIDTGTFALHARLSASRFARTAPRLYQRSFS